MFCHFLTDRLSKADKKSGSIFSVLIKFGPSNFFLHPYFDLVLGSLKVSDADFIFWDQVKSPHWDLEMQVRPKGIFLRWRKITDFAAAEDFVFEMTKSK